MNCKSFTQIVRSGLEVDTQYGAIIPPLHLSANFSFEDFEKPRKYDYSRSGNPTRSLLIDTLNKLENGKGAVVTSSGLSAINLLLQTLNHNDLIIAPHDSYGGTWRMLNAFEKKGQFKVLFVNLNDPEALSDALNRKPKQVWIETPSNPLLRIYDIELISKKAHSVGAEVVVDNTFLSPILQNPIQLGADYVIHSTTKFINGHSDIIGGCVITNCEEKAKNLAWWANALGLTGAAFDSWLCLRGIRTLELRIKKQQENAEKICSFLAEHPYIDKIYYPGIKSHSGYEIACKQQKGFGSMISFELKKSSKIEIKNFISALKHFSLAESLGGIESLIAHPASMTHAAMSEEARKISGIKDNLIRLSIGIEDSEDLVFDLKNALEK